MKLFSLLVTLIPLTAVTADASPLHWQTRVEVASGAGIKGPWRMNESNYRYVDDPAVAVDEAGNQAVVWVDQARMDVFFQRYATDGQPALATPANVSRNPTVFSWLPRVVVTPERPQHVYVLWQEIIFSGGSHGGEILFARSVDGGRTFQEPRNLSRDPAGSGKGRLTRERWHNGSLDLAYATAGILYAAWTDYEGRLWLSRSTDAGDTFSEPRQVVRGTDAPARAPAMATRGRDTVYLTWSVGERATADIHLARSTNGGRTFSTARTPAATEGHSDAPKLLVDQAGALHLVFAESPRGPFERYQIAYLRAPGWREPFSEPVKLSASDAGRFAGASFPHLAEGRAGHLYVLWELYTAAGARPRALGYAVSCNHGHSWAPPAVVPGSGDPAQGINGSLQGLLMEKLGANRSGQVAVVNSTFRPGQESHVWLLPAHTDSNCGVGND